MVEYYSLLGIFMLLKQQDKISLTSTFDAHFDKIECFTIDHKTPFDTLQNFIFCSFKHR